MRCFCCDLRLPLGPGEFKYILDKECQREYCNLCWSLISDCIWQVPGEDQTAFAFMFSFEDVEGEYLPEVNIPLEDIYGYG